MKDAFTQMGTVFKMMDQLGMYDLRHTTLGKVLRRISYMYVYLQGTSGRDEMK
jgi:hypothetical protein